MLSVSHLPQPCNAATDRLRMEPAHTQPDQHSGCDDRCSLAWHPDYPVRRTNLLTNRIDYVTTDSARACLSGIVSPLNQLKCRGAVGMMAYRLVDQNGSPPRIWPGEGDLYRLPKTKLKCMAYLAGARVFGVNVPAGDYVCVRMDEDTWERLVCVLCPAAQDPEAYKSDFYYLTVEDVRAFRVAAE